MRVRLAEQPLDRAELRGSVMKVARLISSAEEVTDPARLGEAI